MLGNYIPLMYSCREGNGNPLQCSCLENPRDMGAWWAAVHGVAKSRTWLSDFTFTFHFHALEKEMATHSSVLAWRIPGMGEPGGLPSMGSHRVGHDWSDLAAAAASTIKLACCSGRSKWPEFKLETIEWLSLLFCFSWFLRVQRAGRRSRPNYWEEGALLSKWVSGA